MDRLKPLLVLAAALGFALSPFFVTSFAGFDPGLFPVPQDDPPVQPAGYAFSIWGPIYLWLIAGAAFGLLKRAGSADWAAMRWPLFASLAPGMFWLWVAERSPIWSTLLIWWMLAMAVLALLRCGSTDRWWQRTPVALYAGWLSAAASVSLGLLAAGYGLTGPIAAALGALAVAVVLGCAVQAARADTPEYGLAIIWALVAVIVANAAPANPWIIGAALIGIAAIAATWAMRRGTVRTA